MKVFGHDRGIQKIQKLIWLLMRFNVNTIIISRYAHIRVILEMVNIDKEKNLKNSSKPQNIITPFSTFKKKNMYVVISDVH